MDVIVRRHAHPARRRGKVFQFLELRRIFRHGLFDQHMPAGREGGPGVLEMRVIGAEDQHRIHIRIGEQGRAARIGVPAQPPRERLGPLDIGIEDAGEDGPCHAAFKGLGIELGDDAGPDHGDALRHG